MATDVASLPQLRHAGTRDIRPKVYGRGARILAIVIGTFRRNRAYVESTECFLQRMMALTFSFKIDYNE